MEIGVILHQMIQLFVIMMLGYMLYKVRLFDSELNKKLTKLLLNFTLPALVMASVLEQPAERDRSAVGIMLLISAGIYIVLPLLSVLLTKLLRIPREQQGVYMFMLTYSNVGFMGFPIINAIYGSTGVFYAAILNIMFNVSTFSVGVLLMNYGDEKGKTKIEWGNLLSPGIICSVLSVVVYLSGISFPEDLVSVCGTIGDMTIPLSMLIIGATLATMRVWEVFRDWRLYPFTLVKLLGIPLLMWLLFRLTISDPVIFGTCTILMMMPVANSTVLFANVYEKDEKLGARGVFLTTLLSIVTVPLLLYLIT